MLPSPLLPGLLFQDVAILRFLSFPPPLPAYRYVREVDRDLDRTAADFPKALAGDSDLPSLFSLFYLLSPPAYKRSARMEKVAISLFSLARRIPFSFLIEGPSRKKSRYYLLRFFSPGLRMGPSFPLPPSFPPLFR